MEGPHAVCPRADGRPATGRASARAGFTSDTNTIIHREVKKVLSNRKADDLT